MPGPQTHQRMLRFRSRALLIGLCAAISASCDQPQRTVAPDGEFATAEPRFTSGYGSTATFIGQATYSDVDKVKRMDKDWKVDLKAKGGLEVIVRSFSYDPGSYTGWHRHPGPVLIQVIEGTLTFYEANDPCTPITVSAGHGYVDSGEHGHIGRNLTGSRAKDVTIYFAPPGTQVSELRSEIPEPAEVCNP